MEPVRPYARAFVVIEKERTRIWEDQISKHSHPVVINNPLAIPKRTAHPGVRPTSNYDIVDSMPEPKSTLNRSNFFTALFKSGLNDKYMEKISEHLAPYELIYLVGERRGLHNLISVYLSFVTVHHPEIPIKVVDTQALPSSQLDEDHLVRVALKMLDIH